MSARLPDPLVVTTRDAGSWWKRAVDVEGHGLYARAGCTDVVPELRSVRELAVFGLTGMADCLPVPVGPTPPSELDRMRQRLVEVERAYSVDMAALQRQIDGLERDRHDTNEALDDAVRALRALERPAVPDGITRQIAPTQALQPVAEDVSPQVSRLRSLLAGQREAVDGEHYAVVHHDYRTPRDLPELGGQR